MPLMSNHINDGDVKMKRKKNNTVFYMLSKTRQQDAVISAKKSSYLTASAMPRRNRNINTKRSLVESAIRIS